jgi:hypothetical protein
MELDRKEVHDIRNQLAISIGMVELAIKMLVRDGKEADLAKITERLEKSIAAQQKLKGIFETPEPNQA